MKSTSTLSGLIAVCAIAVVTAIGFGAQEVTTAASSAGGATTDVAILPHGYAHAPVHGASWEVLFAFFSR